MFNKVFYSVIATLLLLALPASATWDVVPGSGNDDCSFPRYIICYSDLTSDTTSGTINTAICENWSFHWISDIAATSYDTTVNVRWSLSSTESVNTSEIVNNATLTGDPSTGLDVLAGYDAPWLYLDIAVYSASDTGRGALQCFQRARN